VEVLQNKPGRVALQGHEKDLKIRRPLGHGVFVGKAKDLTATLAAIEGT
jgi:hypothetical protein